MKPITFRHDKFCADVAKRLLAKRGLAHKLILDTGISSGMLNRIMYDRRVRDYEAIVNIADALGLDVAHYTNDSRKPRADSVNREALSFGEVRGN